MIDLDEKDFGLLLFATLSKKDIKIVNKPLMQKNLYDLVKHPLYKVLFNGLYVHKDELNDGNSYVDLTNAFNSSHLRGIILAGIDKSKSNMIYNILTEQKADRIIMYIDKKYGDEYSLLMDKMADYLVLKGFNYYDSDLLNDKIKKKLELH